MKSSDRTKVLFILPSLQAGGAERILITLMNNINRDHFEPELLALNDSGPIKDWIADDIPLHSFGNATVKTSIFKLIALIKKTKPDVIFTTMVHSNALALIMKILFSHIRVIVREAALPSVILKEYGIKGRLCVLVYKLLYGKADVVVSNCSQMVHQFENEIKIKTDNHQILFNPVDTARLYSTMPDKFEQIPDRKNTLCFVSLGRLSYEKGYDRLLNQIAETFKPAQNWRLDIIGEGAYRAELEPLIAKHGLKNNVFLQGYQSSPWDTAAQADCLLLPSRWEGMPNVVLEGFACGIPCIAMREAGGIADIAKHVHSESLKICEEIESFVSEMHNVKIAPKDAKAPSILQKEFSLPHIMKGFENILQPNKVR